MILYMYICLGFIELETFSGQILRKETNNSYKKIEAKMYVNYEF